MKIAFAGKGGGNPTITKLSLDSIQKAANHSLIRTLALELTREKIFITEIMAGSVYRRPDW